jgi:hypothetical protein
VTKHPAFSTVQNRQVRPPLNHEGFYGGVLSVCDQP